MNILVLYRNDHPRIRKTIDDSLFCFQRYDPQKNRYFYFNVINNLPKWLSNIQFDGVIFHYSFLALRYSQSKWKIYLKRNMYTLSLLQGFKVAIPQDEYNHTADLWHLFKTTKVQTIFTCAAEEDYLKIYPYEETGVNDIQTVFTGYIDERTVKYVDKIRKNYSIKNIDIGYRARNLPYWLGRHAQLKSELAERFLTVLQGSGLLYDIKNTVDNKDAFLDNDWLKFLLRCRVTIGCLGGSALLDTNGDIRSSVERYLKEHPFAKYNEVESVCFPGKDGYINLYALSPRHFEAAITKTCQILLEGDYAGVFIPDVHYISLKKDYSNINEIIIKIRDTDFCTNMAEVAYKDIVLSGKYTYKHFVARIIGRIPNNKFTIKRIPIIYEVCFYYYQLFNNRKILFIRSIIISFVSKVKKSIKRVLCFGHKK